MELTPSHCTSNYHVLCLKYGVEELTEVILWLCRVKIRNNVVVGEVPTMGVDFPKYVKIPWIVGCVAGMRL